MERSDDRLAARHSEWVQECKDAVQVLRLTIKQAKAHREHCCSVLGAALTAALAFEQAACNCSLIAAKTQEIQRLYAAIIAAIELALQRVQVSPGKLHRRSMLNMWFCILSSLVLKHDVLSARKRTVHQCNCLRFCELMSGGPLSDAAALPGSLCLSAAIFHDWCKPCLTRSNHNGF